MNLCDIETIRAVLGRHGFHFSKSLGQNFLTDESVPRRIAEMSGAAECGNAIEVGPGMGCLSAELCQRADKVVAVELDRALMQPSHYTEVPKSIQEKIIDNRTKNND